MPWKKIVVADEPKVRVIRDTSDASKDYFLPKALAQHMYKIGALDYSITNGTYQASDRCKKDTSP